MYQIIGISVKIHIGAALAHIHVQFHMDVHQWTHIRTYTLVLVLPLPELAMWPPLRGEPAGGNKTGGPIGSGDTSLISPVAWPPQCSRGTHLWACKTHEMREVRYGLE